MKDTTVTWKIFVTYMFLLLLMLLCGTLSGQVTVTHYNAEWNNANDVTWVNSLKDCKTIGYTDVASDKEAQTKYKIDVVPTIIIFKDGEEVARFQADLSFKMAATREEVQEEIDNQLMSDF